MLFSRHPRLMTFDCCFRHARTGGKCGCLGVVPGLTFYRTVDSFEVDGIVYTPPRSYGPTSAMFCVKTEALSYEGAREERMTDALAR